MTNGHDIILIITINNKLKSYEILYYFMYIYVNMNKYRMFVHQYEQAIAELGFGNAGWYITG